MRELIERIVREGELTYRSDYTEVYELEVEGRRLRVVCRTAMGGRKLPPVLQEFREGSWRRVVDVAR